MQSFRTFDLYRCYDANGKHRLGVVIWQVSCIATITKPVVKVTVKGQSVQAHEDRRIVKGNLTTIRFILDLPESLKVAEITHNDIVCEVKHEFV